MANKTILVTGGAGYIGSHVARQLFDAEEKVVVLDNLCTGFESAILGAKLVIGDTGDRKLVSQIIDDYSIDTVMHFAAHTSVPESVDYPLKYYGNNICSSRTLIECAVDGGVRYFVFSSSAAVYGIPEGGHASEDSPAAPINPYGTSMLVTEWMLRDIAAVTNLSYVALRYFNVAGSDRQGRIGEDHEPETHLIPICLEVALGQRPHITIFGTDYPTPDGTCIRDYVHVEDLIDAHVTVMKAIKPGDTLTYNVGIGRGYSVREVIDACRRVTGVDFEEIEGQRRPGDPPSLYNDPTKVQRELGWKARFTDLDEIIDTAWQWRQAHPDGYASARPKANAAR